MNVLRCVLVLSLALGVNASGGTSPVWMPTTLMKAHDAAAAASSKPGFKPYQRQARPEAPGPLWGLKLIPKRLPLGAKEFATDLASTVQVKLKRGQESVAESLWAKRVWEDTVKVAVLVAVRKNALNFAIYFPTSFFPSTMFGELGHLDGVAKRHRARVKGAALLMTTLTEGEGVAKATLDEQAPFLNAVAAVLAAPTLEAAIAAVEAAAPVAPVASVPAAKDDKASNAVPAAAAAAARSGVGSAFAAAAAWPAKPTAVAPPAANPAAADAAAAAAAQAKAAARVAKAPLSAVPGPLVKGFARACLEVPLGLAGWAPAFCVRPFVNGQLKDLVKSDAMLVASGGAAGLAALSRRDLQDLCLKRGVGSPAASDDALRAGLAQWLTAVDAATASPLAQPAVGAKSAAHAASSSTSALLADPVRLRAALLSWNAVQACRHQDLAAPHRALFASTAPLSASDAQRPSLGQRVAHLALAAAPAAAAGVCVGWTLGSSSSSGSSGLMRSAPAAPLAVPSVGAGQAVGAALVAAPAPLEPEPPVAPKQL